MQVSTSFSLNEIIAQISVNGNTSLSIPNPQQVVAYVENGLVAKVGYTNFSFLQCTSQNSLDFIAGSAAHAPVNTPLLPSFTFQEGFASSWKTKNISLVTNQAPGNGVLQPGNSYWTYNQKTTNYPPDYNQNVPGAIYNTESGFEYPSNIASVGDPTPNPPQGTGTLTVPTGLGSALSNAYNITAGLPNGTNITGAGIANQGTRLSLQLTSIPPGSTVLVPTQVFLTNSATTSSTTGPWSGVAVLTPTDANGAGAYSPPSAASTATLVAVPSTGLIVYEILFADPFSIETMTVPIEIAYTSNLAQNLPTPGTTAQVAGGFAPFYTRGQSPQPQNPSATLSIPRFIPSVTTTALYSVSKCACDILFPYVVSAAGYDTGIAIANTSLDPNGGGPLRLFGFNATPQQGGVQFWYYGTGANNGAPPGTQCTNVSSPGTCPSPATGTGNVVPAGQVLTYVASTGSSAWGLDNRAAGFVGYVIAQAQFQWCHAFAFIGALGAGPTSQQISEGYLGLILDLGGLNRTTQASENLVN